MTDARRHAPAVARNRDPILAVLRRHLPEQGLLLEVSSGTGEHAAYFAARFPGLAWQPTDPDPAARASIAAWAAAAALPNLRPPLAFDAAAEDWPVARADAVLCINMIHIAPWAAGLGLLRGAARRLAPGGPLLLYGPYRQGGRHTAPSNEAFDAGLRAQNPAWGVRDLETVAGAAAAAGFGPPAIEAMPANNLALVFRRAA